MKLIIKLSGGSMRTLILVLALVGVSWGATRYVRATGGSDANNGSTFALGWATLAYAFDAGNANRMAAGDELRVCADETDFFTVSASVAIAFASSPTTATRVRIVGASLVDGTVNPDGVTSKITTTTALADGLILYQKSNNATNVLFEKLELNAAGQADYCLHAGYKTSIQETFFVYDCVLKKAKKSAILSCMSINPYFSAIEFSEICSSGTGGTGYGIETDLNYSEQAFAGTIRNNKIFGNATGGIRASTNNLLIIDRNLIYKNGGDGIRCASTSGANIVSINSNTLAGNTGDGVDVASGAQLFSIENNVTKGNGGYGIRLNGANASAIIKTGHNVAFGNTLGAIDINGGVLLGANNSTSDPLFVSETNGAEDYRVGAGSPAKNSAKPIRGY